MRFRNELSSLAEVLQYLPVHPITVQNVKYDTFTFTKLRDEPVWANSLTLRWNRSPCLHKFFNDPAKIFFPFGFTVQGYKFYGIQTKWPHLPITECNLSLQLHFLLHRTPALTFKTSTSCWNRAIIRSKRFFEQWKYLPCHNLQVGLCGDIHCASNQIKTNFK